MFTYVYISCADGTTLLFTIESFQQAYQMYCRRKVYMYRHEVYLSCFLNMLQVFFYHIFKYLRLHQVQITCNNIYGIENIKS